MNTMPNDYVTKKDLDRTLDRILKQIFDYVNVVNDGLKERFDQKLLETKISLKEEINGVRKDLQNYQENNSRILDELKDMNKNILGLISYQESKLRVVEKKAHTHSTDML